MDAGKRKFAKLLPSRLQIKVIITRLGLWLRDASYLRLKNVEIGYNFPKKILSKINIGSLRVFATGYNLLTLDKLKIVDPESRPNGNAMYPVVMVINMGLKVGF